MIVGCWRNARVCMNVNASHHSSEGAARFWVMECGGLRLHACAGAVESAWSWCTLSGGWLVAWCNGVSGTVM